MATDFLINVNGVRYTIDDGYLVLFSLEDKKLIVPLIYGGAPIDPNSWSEERLKDHIETARGVSFQYGQDAFGQTCRVSFEWEQDIVQFSLAPPIDFEIMSKEEFYELYQDAIHEEYLSLKE